MSSPRTRAVDRLRAVVARVDGFVDRHWVGATVGVFALAVALLFVHVQRAPLADLGPDGHTYEQAGYETAQSTHLLACENFWHAYWSPTWVSTIALVYSVTGRDPQAIRYLQVALVLATCALLWLAAREAVGRTGAIVAVCLYVFSSLIFKFAAYTQYELIFAFLLFSSGFLVFYRPRAARGSRWGLPVVPSWLDWFQFVGAGIALGAATLVTARGFPMFFVLAAGFYLKGRWKYLARAVPALALGVVCVLGPWTERNRRCYGEWIFATTNGGLNFFVGNNEYSTLGYRTPPTEIMPDAPKYESGVWMRASLDYIKQHPFQTAGRFVAKLFKFWNPHYGDQIVIFALFWIAFLRMAKKRRPFSPEALWLVSMPFVFMLIHAAFYVQVRYVIPALPCMALVASAGLVGWRKNAVARATL